MDENPKQEVQLKELERLLKNLVNYWSLWGQNESYYLNILAPRLVSNPALGDEVEAPLLYAIREKFTPEDWQNLAFVIRECRSGPDRRKKCLAGVSLRAEAKRKQEELQIEAACREEAARLERERQEKERKLQEELQRQREKQPYLEALRDEFRRNFLHAYDYYAANCPIYVTPEEFEYEKTKYVHSWVKNNLESDPDPEQTAAIGAVNGHVQVIARAGSGKTTVLVNRSLFLQQHCGVSPNEMLLLAFNRKAAEEMRDRLTSNLKHGIPHTMTFHALAYALVHPEEEILFDEPEGSKSKSRTLQKVIDDYLHNPKYYAAIRTLMMTHFREDWERIAFGGYDKTPEEMLRYRRSLPREGLDGKYLKSHGEKLIADFLFEHDIKYKYERNFWWDGKNYRPDFTIFTGDNHGLVIEYFGLAGDPDYDMMSEEKRKYWMKKPDWSFVECSPVDLERGSGFFRAKLRQELEASGIVCNRLSEKEIWDRIEKRAIDRFTSLVVGFVQRCRKQSLSPEKLAEKIAGHACASKAEEHFLSLAHSFFRSYLERLQATGEEDFDGLMQKAEALVASGRTKFQRKSGNGDLESLRYVLIDEYQDFSDLFHRLIMALRQKNPKAQFFCVGDDWQAINGFAGSDLFFYENFGRFFHPCRKLHLRTNYRSAISIVDVGNRLMEGHGTPARANKRVHGSVVIADLDSFQPSPKEQETYSGDNLTPAVLRLVIKALASDQDIVLLSRKNTLPFYINNGDKEIRDTELDWFLRTIRVNLHKEDRKRVEISTTHKYKGLEKKAVIVLDAVYRCYPLLHPDLVFTRILGDSIERTIDEERRLFYVALTRAAETLFIMTDKNNTSPFLDGLLDNTDTLEWSDYPPLVGATKRIVVRVGNQIEKGGNGTYEIKDLLKAESFQWNATGWKAWFRTYPADGFSIEQFFHNALWTERADGIEVHFCDDLENIFAIYRVDSGKWSCINSTGNS